MFKFFLIPTALILAVFYGVFRFGGDYTFLSEGDNISEHPGKTSFNVPVLSGKIDNGVIEIESPYTGIRFVDISHDEEKGMSAKKCGRLKVRLNPDQENRAVFEKSGCFLDW